jgi:hypothetical protein
MSDPTSAWSALLEAVDSLRSELQRSDAQQITATRTRDEARDIVQAYFRQARPELVTLGCDEERIQSIDNDMQTLLRLSRGRNRRLSYLGTMTKLRKSLLELDLQREVRIGEGRQVEATVTMSPTETLIVDTLSKMIPSAALSYEQVILDLSEAERLSYRGVSNELRETLRETLDYLAPDDQVISAQGYEHEEGQTKPTQRQKVRFVLSSRGVSRGGGKVPEGTLAVVDEMTATLTRSIFQQSNLRTHIASSRTDILQMKMYIDSILAELLEIHA